jgi:hypothetical protein
VVGKDIAKGAYIDESNNDLSMNQMVGALGWKKALEAMSEFDNILKQSEMIGEPKHDEG